MKKLMGHLLSLVTVVALAFTGFAIILAGVALNLAIPAAILFLLLKVTGVF